MRSIGWTSTYRRACTSYPFPIWPGSYPTSPLSLTTLSVSYRAVDFALRPQAAKDHTLALYSDTGAAQSLCPCLPALHPSWQIPSSSFTCWCPWPCWTREAPCSSRWPQLAPSVFS